VTTPPFPVQISGDTWQPGYERSAVADEA
jgi:hypothetical protein